MRIPLFLALFLFAPVAEAQQQCKVILDPPLDVSWHLLTQTYGGTVQLVKSLSKNECEFMRNRALGYPATPEEKRAREEKEADEKAVKDAQCLKDHKGVPRRGIHVFRGAALLILVSLIRVPFAPPSASNNYI